MSRGLGPGDRGRWTTAMAIALSAGMVACSSVRDDQGTPGADDQRQLNAAAVMLDSNSVDAKPFGGHESSAHD